MNNSDVQKCIRRLGGIYRDPSRVSRDATTLLNSDAGRHLRPEASALIGNDGSSTKSLLLKGTINMVFRGQTYNIPVDIHLPPAYPVSPPVCFVRPVSTMIIKEGHRHVGRDGMVYMPYLHSWFKDTHNLVDACRNMSNIFGNDPPVFAKPPGYVEPSQRPAVASTPTPPRYEDIAASTAATTSNSGSSFTNPISDAFNRFTAGFTASNSGATAQLSEEEQMAKLAKEAEEANAAVAIARAAEANEKRETALTKEAKNQVAKKSKHILDSFRNSSLDEMGNLVKDQILLEKSRDFLDDKEKGQIAYLVGRKEELEQYHEELDKGIAKLSSFVQNAEEEKSSSKEISADELAVAGDIHSAQMLVLSAENAAINDALYFLDKALEDHQISLDVHLFQYRKLTKRQFLARAHLLKIAQVKAAESTRKAW